MRWLGTYVAWVALTTVLILAGVPADWSALIGSSLGAAWLIHKGERMPRARRTSPDVSAVIALAWAMVWLGGEGVASWVWMHGLEPYSGQGDGIVALLYACAVAPVFEELLWRRSALAGRPAGRSMTWAVTVSSALFAASHLSAASLPFTFGLGVVLCCVAVRRGVLCAMGLHAATNLFTVLISHTALGADLMCGLPLGAYICICAAGVACALAAWHMTDDDTRKGHAHGKEVSKGKADGAHHIPRAAGEDAGGAKAQGRARKPQARGCGHAARGERARHIRGGETRPQAPRPYGAPSQQVGGRL